ncbi:MAG TPA: hypothetical protein VES01_08615 [Dermatophilaceae bacterium]|nr:hypothetical protein [Dermatophilaceae bacterium]
MTASPWRRHCRAAEASARSTASLIPFVVALVFGILLRTFRVFKPSVLTGIDSLGLMMLAIMILVFGPLATVQPVDVKALALPLVIAFVFGVAGIVGASALVGKLLGYSVPMSIAIGLTSLYSADHRQFETVPLVGPLRS